MGVYKSSKTGLLYLMLEQLHHTDQANIVPLVGSFRAYEVLPCRLPRTAAALACTSTAAYPPVAFVLATGALPPVLPGSFGVQLQFCR